MEYYSKWNLYLGHVFEIPNLLEETVKKFNSDFRIVADFFTRWRKNPTFRPENRDIRHVDEMMKFLDTFSDDSRFTKTLEEMRSEGKEVKQMCDVLDRIEEKGIEIGALKRSLEIYEDLIHDGIVPEKAQKIAKLSDEELEEAYTKKII